MLSEIALHDTEHKMRFAIAGSMDNACCRTVNASFGRRSIPPRPL